MSRFPLPILAWFLLLTPLPGQGQISPVDFRYAPDEQWTIIGFPDDWQKTLVNQRGSLCYDFGPGPYARPLTEISLSLSGVKWASTRQELPRPKAPLITTTSRGNGDSLRLTTFALVPAASGSGETWSNGQLRRIGGTTGCVGWVAASDTVDPLFRNAAWGTNRPILYRVKVKPASRHLVVLGFCESYKPRNGMRFLEARVEGATSRTIEPVPDGKRNVPLAFLFSGSDEDGDGWLRVEVHPAGPDPNVFLNGLWLFPPDDPVTPAEVIRGDATRRALLAHSCGTERELLPHAPRADAIVGEISYAHHGTPGRPEVRIRTRRVLRPDPRENGTVLTYGGEPYLFSFPRPPLVSATADGWCLEYPAGTTRIEIVVVHGNHGPYRIDALPDCRDALARAMQRWESGELQLPAPITVPDAALQLLVDASIRTLYQVRERVDGFRQFQPGPTVYRGLWIGDAVLVGIPVAMLGDPVSMREMIEAGARFQQPNGQIRILMPTVSTVETPLWAFGAFWYARTTRDSLLIRRYRDQLVRGLNWICSLRERSFDAPDAPYAGLIPPGFVDGGISTPMADYGTSWWCILALEEGLRAAPAFASAEEIARWRTTRDGFLHSFQTAAERDLRTDRFGKRFLPVGVGDTTSVDPQLGQYSIVLPARYSRFDGQYGAFLDSVVRMNLRMLDGYLLQGLVVSTGWLRNGVWPWMGGGMGLTHQRLGNGDRALEFLCAFSNHASPTGVWVEEQLTKEAGSGSSGDASNAEASAVFLHLIRYLIAAEKGDDFEFLGGLPSGWLRPGAVTALQGGMSEFGPFSLTLTLNNDGRSGRLLISPMDGHGSPGKPFCLLRSLREGGFTQMDGTPLPDRVTWPWHSGLDLQFRRP